MVIASVTIGLLVYLAVGVSTTDGALVKGRCPNVEGQENFDIDQYLGEWNVIESFVNPFHGHDVCLRFDYGFNADGKLRVAFIDNESYMEKLIFQDSSNPAKFHYHLSEEDHQQQTFVENIVFTDYGNHGAEFSCIDLNDDYSIQYAWILSREKDVEPSHLKALKAKLQSIGIDVNNFHTVDQSNCETL